MDSNKRMVWAMVVVAAMLIACSSVKHSASETNVRTELERMDSVHSDWRAYMLRQMEELIDFTFEEEEIRYSAPDSAGKVHPTAVKKSRQAMRRKVKEQDSTAVFASEDEAVTSFMRQDSNNKQVERKERKTFEITVNELLKWLLAIALVLTVGVSLIAKKKQRHKIPP